MCGVLGLVVSGPQVASSTDIRECLDAMFTLASARGREASGVAVVADRRIDVWKEASAGSDLVGSSRYQQVLQRGLEAGRGSASALAVMGHSRLATNGAHGIAENNQPVVTGSVVGIHNGIVVNHEQLRRDHPGITTRGELDTEVMMAVLDQLLAQGLDLTDATATLFSQLRGSATISVGFDDRDELLLATNTGSLFLCADHDRRMVAFMSERWMLDKVRAHPSVAGILEGAEVRQVAAHNGVVIDLATLAVKDFSLAPRSDADGEVPPAVLPEPPQVIRRTVPRDVTDHALTDDEARAAMRRCTRCILPETMPLISFDADGVCSFCRTYEPINPKGPEALAELVSRYRRDDGRPDMILPFSGGRDSSYALHYLVEELGMKPMTFTYDWGMVNDLARRNQARMVGALGVEHVIVAADIVKKRKNIRKNVEAWIRRPDLGMVPLFMAGDKQFFYYCNQLMKQTGLELVMWASNKLERTNFKSGFSGLQHTETKDVIADVSFADKMRMVGYYGKQYLTNPAYLNRSIPDTAFAFVSYYFMLNKQYSYIFDYLPWEEDVINRTLIDGYDWETAPGTSTTWRIGDGTAAFYNYVYYSVVGFTENDTFRSNQIREGMLTREEALALVAEENQPQFAELAEYCALIGVSLDELLEAVGRMPRLYAPDDGS